MSAKPPQMQALRRGALIAALLLISLPVLDATADDWSLRDKDGVVYTLSAQHGKWVLVNFWAPWCPTCLQEMPEFLALQKQHKELQIIGVAVMYRKKQEVVDVVKSQAVSYPVVFGNEDTASGFGGMTVMPTSFLYTPSGNLLGRHEGPLGLVEIEQAMKGNNTSFKP